MKTFFTLLALVAFSLSPARAAQRNVLLIIADDYGIDSNSLYNTSPGAALPPTPNINALKASGVLFRNCYAMLTCSPTRATMLTGRNPYRHGVATALTANDGLVTLTWSSVEGGRYTIEQNPDLTSGWTNAATNIPGAAFTTPQTISAPGTKGFYRVRRDSVDTHDTVNTP